VEDEEGVRRLMHRLLEREGYRLLSARSAEAADVVMPGMTGPQLAERLKPRRPTMKVLFVSGYRHDALDQKGLLGRGAHILAKPFPSAQFLRQVHLLMKGGRPA
jgi:CheY-like chemotaxis protein